MDFLQLICLSIWVVIGLIAFVVARNNSWHGAGISLAFFINMAVLHWIGALVSFLPWYWPKGGRWLIESGFNLSTVGIVAFAVGCFGIAPFVSSGIAGNPDWSGPRDVKRSQRVFLLTGLACYAGMALGLGKIPSATAVLLTGFYLVLVSICLGFWETRLSSNKGRFVILWAGTLALPVLTMIHQGFLGFGIGYVIVVSSFWAAISSRPIRLLLLAVPLAFLALSLEVTWMRNREEIRAAVWGGTSYERRAETIATTLQTGELFDPKDDTHLRRIDIRLNQNYFVGAAVSHLKATGKFANGETLWMALTALVPRILWPDKPVEAGSMGLVSKYTGLRLSSSTSFGMGLIFEFYINYGLYGVIFGLLVIGVFVGIADRKAGSALRAGLPTEFAMWFIIGIFMLNVGGSLVAIAPGLIAAVVISRGLKYLLEPRTSPKPSESLPDERVNHFGS